MVERKLFKTKLCLLYQKGRCNRQNCSFAHGNADLRRSINGRSEQWGRDLREKLDRRRSPDHRFSSANDVKRRRASHGAFSPRSLSRRNDLKHWNKQLDGEGEFSGNPKSSEVNEDEFDGQKQVSSDSRDIFDEQLRKMQSEINLLMDHKRHLELYLQECVQEADGLTSKIQDLEMQLNKEKENCKRITSKIRKFTKAYSRHSRLQDGLKRSNAQLQKLGDMLTSDVLRSGTYGEDLSNNLTSDEEPAGYSARKARDEPKKIASSNRKRARINPETDKELNQDNNSQGEETRMREIRSSKFSQFDVHYAQPDRSKQIEMDDGGKNGFRLFDSEGKAKREKITSIENLSTDKSKLTQSSLALLSTSMAAHPVDEVVEIVENDRNFDGVGDAAATYESELAVQVTQLPFLPPPPPLPPIPQNAYSQFNGGDESVDIDGVDAEIADVDID